MRKVEVSPELVDMGDASQLKKHLNGFKVVGSIINISKHNLSL